MRSLISVLDLNREDVLNLYQLFLDFKRGRREKLDGSVMLLFLENSTRTRLSFEKACRQLGLETYYAGKGETSIDKGETLLDTFRTLRYLGFDAVVFRIPFVLFPYQEYIREGIVLVNAGDGTHQHPTQGLVDLFTAMEVFGSLEGVKVLFVGDILHSRVFRSTVPLFRMMGAQIGICGPATLLPYDPSSLGVSMVFHQVEEGLRWADLVEYLRLQKERFKENYVSSERSYFAQFGMTKERYEGFKGYVMHPGPVNLYVDMDPEVVYGERSLVAEQVRNGVFVRMAVMYYLMKDG